MDAGYPVCLVRIARRFADNRTTREFAHEKETKAPEGTTTGVTTGGLIGGTLGVLAGIGALAIPGVGPLIAISAGTLTLLGTSIEVTPGICPAEANPAKAWNSLLLFAL